LSWLGVYPDAREPYGCLKEKKKSIRSSKKKKKLRPKRKKSRRMMKSQRRLKITGRNPKVKKIMACPYYLKVFIKSLLWQKSLD
jgi:hypothetical protein